MASFVTLTDEEKAKLVAITSYRTRYHDYMFHDLYYNPEKRQFLRYISYYDCYAVRDISKNRNQYMRAMSVDRKAVGISFAELQKQYSEISNLYDNTKPIRATAAKKNETADTDSSTLDVELTDTSFSVF